LLDLQPVCLNAFLRTVASVLPQLVAELILNILSIRRSENLP
jgi:hypothetical protein